MDDVASTKDPVTHVAVVVASAGRPGAILDLCDAIDLNSTRPNLSVTGILSVRSVRDLPDSFSHPRWKVLATALGASAQRNAALDQVDASTDFVFFFDDDALPRYDYIANAVRFFESQPCAVAITGDVVVDGAAEGREVSIQEAREALRRSVESEPGPPVAHNELYGCNFAVRWQPLAELRFDERLPLYSWLEDLDYAKRASRSGDIYRVPDCVAAHRGSASGGRVAHRRFGYSQVANPLWLREKGTLTVQETASLIAGPLVKNLALSALPGRLHTSRRQRLCGNVLAAFHAARNSGRATPEYISTMN